MDFSVRILGSNSALPNADNFASAQVVHYNNKPFLIDCAEGTQMQMRKFKVPFGRLKNIFISHLHGDHFFGLFGLLSTFSLLGRKQKLSIYAPSGLEDIIKSVFGKINYLPAYNIEYISLNPNKKEKIMEDKYIQIHSFPLKHSIEVFGFLFTEKQKDFNVRKDCISKYNLQISDIIDLKKGKDIVDKNGNIIKNEVITLKPPPVRSYAYCTDTIYLDNLKEYIKGVDLLYHEATFEHKDTNIAHLTGHSTSVEAAKAAKDVKAKRLMIGHFSTRYKSLEMLLEQAKSEFKETILARDGLIVHI